MIYVTKENNYSCEIHNIDLKCFPDDNWSETLISNEILNESSQYIIYTHSGQPCAYICFRHLIDEMELDRIAVLHDFRNKNIASGLVEEMIQFAGRNNVSRITLEVRKNNVPAISLYKKYGFTQDCIRKNYYNNPKDDAILMSLILKN